MKPQLKFYAGLIALVVVMALAWWIHHVRVGQREKLARENLDPAMYHTNTVYSAAHEQSHKGTYRVWGERR